MNAGMKVCCLTGWSWLEKTMWESPGLKCIRIVKSRWIFSGREHRVRKVTDPEVLIYRSRVAHRARRGSKTGRKQEEPRRAGAGECPERARWRVVLKGVSAAMNAAKKTNKRRSRNSPLDLATRCCLWYWQQFRGEMKMKARRQWTWAWKAERGRRRKKSSWGKWLEGSRAEESCFSSDGGSLNKCKGWWERHSGEEEV